MLGELFSSQHETSCLTDYRTTYCALCCRQHDISSYALGAKLPAILFIGPRATQRCARKVRRGNSLKLALQVWLEQRAVRVGITPKLSARQCLRTSRRSLSLCAYSIDAWDHAACRRNACALAHRTRHFAPRAPRSLCYECGSLLIVPRHVAQRALIEKQYLPLLSARCADPPRSMPSHLCDLIYILHPSFPD